MHVIYRKNIAKNFRYTTNIYNHRYGCTDEEAKNKNTLELYVNKIKMFYITQNVKPGSRFFIDIYNASLGYFALVIAIAELKCIICDDKNAQIKVDRISLDDALNYNIKDSKKCTSINKNLPEKTLPLYETNNNVLTHEQCFDLGRKNFDNIKGDVLLVSNEKLTYNITSIVLPFLINSNITNRLALGYQNFDDAKHKIAHTIIHHNVDQVFTPKETQTEIQKELYKLNKNLEITYFSY